MKTNKKLLINLVALVMMVSILVITLISAFFIGRLSAAVMPTWSIERPLCAVYDTDVRTTPTGYIIGHVQKDHLIWFFGLDLPFARVAYYDGHEWLTGIVTATVLQPCTAGK